MRSIRTIVLLTLAAPVFAAEASSAIKVDQVGYLTSAPKLAFVASTTATQFTLNQSKDGKVVFPGPLSAPSDDLDSGDSLRTANFSAWTKSGTYYIDVPGVGRSWDFEIGPNVYTKTFRLAMRAFYGQRCGSAVDLGPEFAGYKHDACHLDGAFHPSSGKTGPHVSKGGWHDAGDYGRYIVNSGISTGTLLWTYEIFGPRVRNVNLAIPESGNGAPDILNEAKWNLDWMLTMQDEDGGVWHKQTSDKFADFVMPEKDKLPSLVIGTGKEPFKSTCATGDFAAVMAIASRIFPPFNPSFATRCQRAAEKAWTWMEKNPKVAFENPPGVSTGAYHDENCADERLWAAAELFRSTGNKEYEDYFLKHYADFRKPVDESEPPSWQNVGKLARWTFAFAKNGNPVAANAIRQDVIGTADNIVKNKNYNGYRISLNSGEYVWGSNGVLANYGMELLVADALAHNEKYRDAAFEDLHYLLGRNTFSLSFVTRVGENSVRHPHHRPSIEDNNAEPWPGLLVGGPNTGREDPLLKKLPSELPPAKTYVDDQESYASNEVAINWNAPLVFLLAGALDPGPAPEAAAQPQRKSRKQH